MKVLPVRDSDAIEFCETHVGPWAGSATGIGLTAAQVTNLTNLTTAARTAFNTAMAARDASRSATLSFQSALRSMRGNAADLIRIIKGFAEAAPDPAVVYSKAQIPPPAAPQPRPAPGMPEMVVVELNSGGSLTIKWNAKNASPSTRAVFDVARRIGSDGSYIPLGSGINIRGKKFEYTDTTLPFGSQTVSYIIRGRRGTDLGPPSEAVTVQFGVGGGGGGFAVVSGATAAKAKAA